MTLSQIAATAIFLLMFIAIIWGKVHRYIPAIVGGAMVLIVVFLGIERSPDLITRVLNMGQLWHFRFWFPGTAHIESSGINWQTIIFIGGMMVMVEGLGKVGFFRWLCLLVAKLVNYRVIPIFISFMLLSGFLAMFIDSITVLLFMASVTIELARLLKFDPVPVIIAEIFAANTGGSATMCGDPPNIIIGTAFGYTFFDFAMNTGPIAWSGMIVALLFFYLVCRRTLARIQNSNIDMSQKYPAPKDAITNSRLFKINTSIFLVVVILLITHAQTGISVALIGVIASVLVLGFAGKDASHILKGVDWKTLVFFIGLFVCVGGMEETGVLKILAEYIGNASGGNMALVVPIVLWLSAFASAIVDNIPFAATMVPVIRGLSETAGFSLHTLSWTLALGTDIGGNATPIGASANVVGAAIAEREGYPVSWVRFLKYSVPSTILLTALCWFYLSVRYL